MVVGVTPIELRLIIPKKYRYRYYEKNKAISENSIGEKRVYVWHQDFLDCNYKTMAVL